MTLNGKKSRIERRDFEKAILGSGISEKVAKKFRKALIKWLDLIDQSFLPDDFKKQYKRLVIKHMVLLR